jgi:uncharacterized protein YbjT (DUF2867 family)
MAKPRILVTGAARKTGAPTALQQLAKGYAMRAFVRQVDGRAERLQRAGAEERALHGVARAYFCPPLEPGTLRRATLFAAAAREAKVEVVVQLSQWVADPAHPAAHAREKWLSNQVLSWLPDVGRLPFNRAGSPTIASR